jgi:hypothetical protein
MHRRNRIIGGLVGLSAIVTLLGAVPSVAAASTASTVATSTSVCTDGRWPSSVQGVPTTFKAGASAGDYIWHGSTSWHLRVTHPGSGRVVFTGKVVASAPVEGTPVKLEPNDVVSLSADRKTITYRLVNYGRIDGFNFTTACARQIAFGGWMSGVRLPTWRIWIGHYGRHPLENPFAVRRIA